MRQEEFEDRAHNISPEQIASLLSKLASEDNRWKYRKNIAFAENISPKRLKNAIKHFAHISTDETPLMLWDLTTFRSGKAGMLVTETSIYVKYVPAVLYAVYPITPITDQLAWSEIESVEMKSALLGRNHIWVNGKIFFSAPSQEDQLAITELIKSIVEQARKEASPMNPQSSPTIPNVFADFHSSLPPELDDANFESNVYSDNKLHLIYFYWQSQIKEAAAITNELYLSRRYSSKYTISKMNLANNPLTHEKLGFSIAPTIAVFKDKQVIGEVSGESVKWNIVVTHLNSLIEQYSRVKGTETLDNLTSKLARKSEKRRIFGKVERWEFALISGLVSGVVLAFVRSKLEGGIAFLVVALAYGIFILRLNFTVLQRLFATALMLSVGFYWREIIDALRKLLN